MANTNILDTAVGKILITEEGGSLTGLAFASDDDVAAGASQALGMTTYQLFTYFEGTEEKFDLPMKVKGTDFQIKVWKLLCEIPYGETATYGEIAKKLGDPNATRAVGAACNKNPIPIIIPCHRVIGSSGETTGYAGGTEIKEKLLALEKGYLAAGTTKKKH